MMNMDLPYSVDIVDGYYRLTYENTIIANDLKADMRLVGVSCDTVIHKFASLLNDAFVYGMNICTIDIPYDFIAISSVWAGYALPLYGMMPYKKKTYGIRKSGEVIYTSLDKSKIKRITNLLNIAFSEGKQKSI